MNDEDDRHAQNWIHYVEAKVEYETFMNPRESREVKLREYTKLQLAPPRWHAHPWIQSYIRYA